MAKNHYRLLSSTAVICSVSVSARYFLLNSLSVETIDKLDQSAIIMTCLSEELVMLRNY